VGSGKSSLLAALLGDIKKNRGKVRTRLRGSCEASSSHEGSSTLTTFVRHHQVTVRGDVALITQQAWIQNATLKDNILYGSEYDPERFVLTMHTRMRTRTHGDCI
jgi:ABC-type transport system involved in cytochrome bd biosynthesis fused ATPase/permease subunit